MKHTKKLLIASLVLAIGFGLFTNSVFVFGFLAHPSEVGALLPCSQVTAKKICAYVKKADKPLEILEVGSGTGALTKEIINCMKEGDHLDMVELLPDYCTSLKAMETNNVRLFCGSILDWQPNKKYDIIICSLPFNSFEKDFIEKVITNLKSLAKEGCIFSYVEYMGSGNLREWSLSGEKKKAFQEARAHLKQLRDNQGIQTDKVFFNLPPLYIHHVKL